MRPHTRLKLCFEQDLNSVCSDRGIPFGVVFVIIIGEERRQGWRKM
jgi:hypothetical protein